jgi:hypothetical protein
LLREFGAAQASIFVALLKTTGHLHNHEHRRSLMNKPLVALIRASLLLLGAQSALAAETEMVVTAGLQFRPVTMAPDQATSAPLIASVERALSRYAAGCEAHDENAIAEVFTSFAVIAYASSVPGRFVATNATTAERCWAASALTSARESPIWLYPTSEQRCAHPVHGYNRHRSGATHGAGFSTGRDGRRSHRADLRLRAAGRFDLPLIYVPKVPVGFFGNSSGRSGFL